MKAIMCAKIEEWKPKIKSCLNRNGFYLLIGLILLCLAIMLINKKFELVPATLFSAVTAVFSYLAYKFSKEKFRLDLFDKRWEVYEHTLDFCSKVTQQGSLKITEGNKEEIIAAINAAHNSFRGIGWHKTKALFGEDIHLLFEELNKRYSWLLTYSERPSDPEESAKWPKNRYENSIFIWKTVEKLPEVFKPYIYFGDYKLL